MKVIANYGFLPWLRQGIANTITTADGDTSVKSRASIQVALTLSGDPVGGGAELTGAITQNVQLYGPGDVLSFEQQSVANAIVRTDPRSGITNFESNYLPAIEFYDEDFPWRYTPAAPDATGLHLRPWIALVVLAAGEFSPPQLNPVTKVQFVTASDVKVFPHPDDLWAWAHVHFNTSLSGDPNTLVSPDMTQVLPRVASLLQQNPDLAYSRLVCPRRLDDNTSYTAFVMPVFETGRLAALNEAITAAPHATFSAWASYAGKPEPANFPFFYSWSFQTGSHGDFEYLVRLLQPLPVDARVGTRDMDVQDPGSNLPGITDPAQAGILKLGGALRVPDQDLTADELALRQKYENWDQPYPDNFEVGLAKFINLPDDYAINTAEAANAASAIGPGIDDDPDPLITAPLYGRWQALTQRLLFDRSGAATSNTTNWVHRLNLDPRFRVSAAFGTDVVETNAEEYMNDAWEQIGDVLAANSRIRRLLVAREVSWRWHETSVKPLAAANSERAFSVLAPVASRVMASPTTILYTQRSSLLPPVYTSAVMRRLLRPGSRLIRTLPFSAAVTPQNLMTRVNNGEVSPAPPVVVPPGVTTVDKAAGATPTTVPGWIATLLSTFPWLPLAVLIAAIVVALLFLVIPVAGLVIAIAIVVGGFFLYRKLLRWQQLLKFPTSLSEDGQTPQAVDQYPKSPDFTIQLPGSTVRPTMGTTDSPTAVRFKGALRDSFSMIVNTRTVSARPAPVALSLAEVTTKMVTAVDPQVTIPKRGLSIISIPSWIVALIGDNFGEVMAYPKIDLPMYEPLKDISSELFLPNLNLILPNSITLIETNQRFIEAYMVGLNHEFARKLLWREYPTDQRGSYFRQFWDPRSYRDTDNLTPDQLKEKLYDIPELHRWALTSNLGDHNNRATLEKGEEAVLVIRGELLKRYPTAVIYAHHAQWTLNKDGSIDHTQPRTLQDIDAAFEDNPPLSIVRMPLYEAKVDPDIYFFGFDLTIAEAKGGPGNSPSDDPGWFFVIKERPGEPRFGLELARSGPLEVFDELTWDDAVPGIAPGSHLPAASLSTVSLQPPPPEDPEGKRPQYTDDVQVATAAVSSARWAYLLFRQPVMVAVHADEMLRSS
jgi:hypothetical protein